MQVWKKLLFSAIISWINTLFRNSMITLISPQFPQKSANVATLAAGRVWFDLSLSLPCTAHHSNYTSACRLCIKPSSVHFHFLAKIRNLFNHNARIPTIVRLGPHLLHHIHVVDHDASGDVGPACGFAVHHDDILQPWHVTQDGLKREVGCRRECEGWVRGTSSYANWSELVIKP